YGEDASIKRAKDKNLLGALVKQYDQAGMQELKLATPAGLPLEKERRLAAQFVHQPDWNEPKEVVLSAEIYKFKYQYDALGRLTQKTLPDQTVRKFTFKPEGGRQKISVSTADGKLVEKEIVKEIDYN